MSMTDTQMAEHPMLAAAVVSRSPLMRRRLSMPLIEAGFKVSEIAGPDGFFRIKRQRPFALCFFDVRGTGPNGMVQKCFEARPGERYVIVRGEYTDKTYNSSHCGTGSYGSISEAFTRDEVIDWASRAATEERLALGEQPLEELLYDRFKGFLYHLGPASIANLHDLVLERVERPLLQAVLEWTGGNQSQASEMLGIHRNTLRTKMRKLSLSETKNGGRK